MIPSAKIPYAVLFDSILISTFFKFIVPVVDLIPTPYAFVFPLIVAFFIKLTVLASLSITLKLLLLLELFIYKVNTSLSDSNEPELRL